ncbi:uncharacterized protein HKW66_Vig0100890 [Vigna angularis]|uniref:Uncharacterized protein n=1 Tax=Phaseolus angularis TaxID=3914 RepID=A0A8T0KJC4_PHAAN|nr:uncharacterized protein HKW66_Vig0100890 [Vigna angularis]
MGYDPMDDDDIVVVMVTLGIYENREILAFTGNMSVKINKKGKLRYGKQLNSRLDFSFLRCGMYRESFLSLPGNSEEKLSENEQQKGLSSCECED